MAAVEFALLLPLMLTLYFGSVEFGDALTIDRKVTHVTSSLADLVTQAKTISNTDMQNILDATASIIIPYNDDLLRIKVSGVSIDQNGVAKVMWSDARNDTALAMNSIITLPTAVNHAQHLHRHGGSPLRLHADDRLPAHRHVRPARPVLPAPAADQRRQARLRLRPLTGWQRTPAGRAAAAEAGNQRIDDGIVAGGRRDEAPSPDARAIDSVECLRRRGRHGGQRVEQPALQVVGKIAADRVRPKRDEGRGPHDPNLVHRQVAVAHHLRQHAEVVAAGSVAGEARPGGGDVRLAGEQGGDGGCGISTSPTEEKYAGRVDPLTGQDVIGTSRPAIEFGAGDHQAGRRGRRRAS